MHKENNKNYNVRNLFLSNCDKKKTCPETASRNRRLALVKVGKNARILLTTHRVDFVCSIWFANNIADTWC